MRNILLALTLLGCSSSVHMSGDASAEGAVCPEPPRITGRGACTWIGGIYNRRALEGVIDRATCPQIECPFPYDSSGRTLVTCDPSAVEQCAWELESRVNNCDGYIDAMALCDGSSCR